MKVLFCANEAAPLYKLGGLGDVSSELPKSLSVLDCDIRLALPFHPEIKPLELHPLTTYPLEYANQTLKVTVFLTILPGSLLPVYLFRESQYISQTSGALDSNIDKAVVYSLAVAHFCHHFVHWQPHCLHLNDWHTALIPLFIKHLYDQTLPSLITIHNHRYTGTTSVNILKKINLPHDSCQILNWDQTDGQLNLLMEGIIHADFINTVSPNYHDELLQETGPLGPILQSKSSVFTGILNGLDYDFWDPSKDSLLAHRYSASNFSQGKSQNKIALQASLGLPQSKLPLIIYIGRVDAQQKGIPLILQSLIETKLPLPDTQFVFLGTGDPQYETKLREAASGLINVSVITRFDEPLAHLLYAAADLIIIPSDYEPCGLIQLIAMRYGTLPVAHATGGLKDTITPNVNGFLYTPNRLENLLSSLSTANHAIKQRSAESLIVNAMKPTYSWQRTSQTYRELYNGLINR